MVEGEIERIENRREKSGDKIDFMGVWLERRVGWKISGAQVFSLLSYQNCISPIWGENIEKRNSCGQ